MFKNVFNLLCKRVIIFLDIIGLKTLFSYKEDLLYELLFGLQRYSFLWVIPVEFFFKSLFIESIANKKLLK